MKKTLVGKRNAANKIDLTNKEAQPVKVTSKLGGKVNPFRPAPRTPTPNLDSSLGE